jgi:hypothetical protein
MKTNPLTGFLVILMIACALWTCWIMYVFTYSNGKIRVLSPEIVAMENLRVTVQNLANEAVQYSKQHPAIDPLLQKFEVKQIKGAAAPTNTVRSPK